jgi:hypothetical protein
MKGDLSLIVLTTGSVDKATHLRFVLERNGVYRKPKESQPIELDTIRQEYSKRLGDEVDGDETMPGVSSGLRTLGHDLYEVLLPKELRNELRAAGSVGDGDAPVLRICSEVDWIPWELMHDGQKFLGMRFQIARLPFMIEPGLGYPQLDSQPRPVEHICNLLGEDAIDDDDLFAKWKKTFSDLPGHDEHEYAFPSSNGTVRGYPIGSDVERAMEEANILHFTCHGKIEAGEVYWTLNGQSEEPMRYQIKEGWVRMMGDGGILATKRPLVFGNACFSAGGTNTGSKLNLALGFGQAFFTYGAVAFVGTFARVSTSLAVRFACEFYRRLLEEGMPIGKALWETKKYYHKEQKASQDTDSSWLFYCLYGSPDTRFQLVSH